MRNQLCLSVIGLTFILISFTAEAGADDFENVLKPFFAKHCQKCHGGDEVNGEINLREIATTSQLLANANLIKEVVEVIDSADMPPEGEPALKDSERETIVASLKTMLRAATAGKTTKRLRVRRLNRFQYNNAVKDLFQLRRDVFGLPEKLMTRHENYLQSPNGMPKRVSVSSQTLSPQAGLQGVKAFPKDLRASHGFDNQANQLTLSPLLLDAFLRLSVSIVESPDFSEQQVGVWNAFFQAPADNTNLDEEVRARLKPFLTRAFRRPVEDETLERYVSFAAQRMAQGGEFSPVMKKVASAVLSSPMFLYRTMTPDVSDDQYELASKLSFFLWASGPDDQLLELAKSGQLSDDEVLKRTIDRMLIDPKIERFLDTFPAQWMQLENVLAATPDPQKYKLFSFDKSNPASLQMLLEPLLLFDAVYLEDRPIIELVAPKFNYRSEFLNTWYQSDLKPAKIDERRIAEENRANDARRQELRVAVEQAKRELDSLTKPVVDGILAARRSDVESRKPVDLKPFAAWEFNGDLSDSVYSLDLTAHGDIAFEDGMVRLERSHLLSKPLNIDLKAKSLEVWCKVHDLNQRGGGVMGVQGPGDFFDTIVLGERKPKHWISGSNGFSRTKDFPESQPETQTGELLHLVMVYQLDGTTQLFRNGKPYGQPYQKGAATFPKNATSIIFGLRHLPPGGNKFLTVSIDKARLYDRALTAAEIAESSSGDNLYVSEKELRDALSDAQNSLRDELKQRIEEHQVAIKTVPPAKDINQLRQTAQSRYEAEIRRKLRSRVFQRVAATDPRYGGVITNAAMLSMTSGPKRTHPIGRGAWVIEVIFNDPPPPPPNDVPPLNDKSSDEHLTIREKFAKHRSNPDCAACHTRLDPLGFALENYDITGRWRDKYENGRDVDSSGTLLRKHRFDGAVQFKESLVKEERRFAKAFAAHLLRFATTRELLPADSLTVDAIVTEAEKGEFRLKTMIREVILSESFSGIERDQASE